MEKCVKLFGPELTPVRRSQRLRARQTPEVPALVRRWRLDQSASSDCQAHIDPIRKACVYLSR